MASYTKHVSSRQTNQSEPIFGREAEMVENSAGGFVFPVDDWTRLKRFLILGSEGGSYYASEKKLTIENAIAVAKCIAADGPRVVREIVEVSTSGRAPKQDPAIFALALCAGRGDETTKREALAAMPRVCRTGTHLFMFLRDVQAFRGWGRALRRSVANWYNDRNADSLAYQVLKYANRLGWTHRDVLRQCHAKSADPAHQALYAWITRDIVSDATPKLVHAVIEAKSATTVSKIIQIIADHPNLPFDVIPSEMQGKADVWTALLPNLKPEAMLRSLGRCTANGLLTPMGEHVRLVREKLLDADAVRAARLHPLKVLTALYAYQSGKSKGNLTWNPLREVLDTLDELFYLSFGAVESTGKRILKALDVSGSMSWSEIAGMPGITPRVGSAAMAMVTARVERDYHFMGFCHEFVSLDISPRQRLDDVLRAITDLRFGGTDCSLPMIWALQHRVPVDMFEIYTDSETWAGKIHPKQALDEYRQKMGIGAKMAVIGMTSNEFSIADPQDAGMMDVVGFDTTTPDLIADFARE